MTGGVREAALGLCAVGLVGCSTASLMLQSPIDQKCQSVGVRGCSEIAEGMILYAEGDKAAAVQKLRSAALKNGPQDLERLARVVNELQAVPGLAPYSGALRDAVAVMVGSNEGSTPRAAHPGGAPNAVNEAARWEVVDVVEEADTGRKERRSDPLGVVTADTDPGQVVGGVMGFDTVPPTRLCGTIAGSDARCRRADGGPFYLTDIESVGAECTGQFVAVLRGSEVRFVMRGPFRIHGARVFVESGDALVVGQVQSSGGASPEEAPWTKRYDPFAPQAPVTALATDPDPARRCSLLWSGFRPYAR